MQTSKTKVLSGLQVNWNCFSNQIFLICKWSYWICVSHHQLIWMGYCGNDLGVSNHIWWWGGYPTRKHEKRRSIQIIMLPSSIAPDKLSDRVVLQQDSVQPLWCTSVTLDLMLFAVMQKTLWNLILSRVSKCSLNQISKNFIWCFLLSRLSKINVDTIGYTKQTYLVL